MLVRPLHKPRAVKAGQAGSAQDIGGAESRLGRIHNQFAGFFGPLLLHPVLAGCPVILGEAFRLAFGDGQRIRNSALARGTTRNQSECRRNQHGAGPSWYMSFHIFQYNPRIAQASTVFF